MKALEKEKMHALLDAVIDAGKQGEGEGAAPYAYFAIGPGHLAISIDDRQGRDFWETEMFGSQMTGTGRAWGRPPAFRQMPGRLHPQELSMNRPPGEWTAVFIFLLMFLALASTFLGAAIYSYFTYNEEMFGFSLGGIFVAMLIGILIPCLPDS